jgi:hypothetical protein
MNSAFSRVTIRYIQNPNNIHENERSRKIRRMKGYEKEGKKKGRGKGKVA